MINPLVLYAFTFVLTNSPTKLHVSDESALAYAERALSIAEDVATVVSDEEPLYPNDETRVRTVTLLLSVAFYESSFQAYVDNGDCLRPDWGRTAFGKAMIRAHASCDLGNAGSIFQIHGGEWFLGARLPEPYELAHDRKLAVRTALRMIRIDTSLGAYVGVRRPDESIDQARVEMARQRTAFAAGWIAKHPALPDVPAALVETD